MNTHGAVRCCSLQFGDISFDLLVYQYPTLPLQALSRGADPDTAIFVAKEEVPLVSGGRGSKDGWVGRFLVLWSSLRLLMPFLAAKYLKRSGKNRCT